MALTFAQLQELVKNENVHYFIAPDRPVVRFGIRGMFGQYEIVISLQDDGKFIQFRTVGYLNCLANNANLNAVLQTLATINFTKRLVKYAWDSSDGEIVASWRAKSVRSGKGVAVAIEPFDTLPKPVRAAIEEEAAAVAAQRGVDDLSVTFG